MMMMNSLLQAQPGRDDTCRAPSISVGWTEHSPGVIVRMRGSLWTPVGPELRHAIDAVLRQGQRRVLLDLREVTRIDAAGVGELACAYSAVQAAGGVLRVARASDRVRRVLAIVGLLALLSGDERSAAVRSRADPCAETGH